MIKHITFFVLCMFLSTTILGQTQMQGNVSDAETGEPIVLTTVALFKGGVLVTGTDTDFDGNYFFGDLDPGTYDIQVSYVGYPTKRIEGVVIEGGKTTPVDITLSSAAGIKLDEIVIVGYEVPLISFDETTSGNTLTSENIEKLPQKNIQAIAATSAGASVDRDGKISIRGSRPDATFYYIDGVRVSADNAAQMIPQAQIEQLQVITGGIEARYGDVTGGVISITSKGPSNRFTGGIEAETSEFLDAYGYNLLNANLSGPIIKKGDNSIVGFRVFGQYRNIADSAPSGVGVYRAPQSVIDDLEAKPITFLDGIPYSSAQFLTKDQVGAPLKASPNDDDIDLNFGAKIDAKLSDAMDISISGSYYDRSNRFDVNRAWSMYNWVNNPYENRDGYRGTFRFRHKLGTQGVDEEAEKTSTIRGASYTLQFGYEKGNITREDFQHEDNLFRYGYYGNTPVDYEQYRSSLVTDTGYNKPVAIVNGEPFAFQGVSGVEGEFEGSSKINKVLGFDDYLEVNGQRNDGRTDVFNMFNNVGRVYNLNRSQEEDRYTVNVNAGFDIFPSSSSSDGKHNIQFGFMYEQRVLRRWEMTPMALWEMMRSNINAHITNGVDTSMQLGMFIDPVSGEELPYYAPNDESDQFPDNKFFKAIRDQQNLISIDWVNSDGLDPDNLTLDMFSPFELNGFQNLNLRYYGTDYLGNNLPSSTTFNDFFDGTDENGRRTFDIAPFQPNYIAGYLQDKFTFKDIIFRLGVRLDYYDANTKVLIDPLSFSEVQSAAEFYSDEDIKELELTQPESVQDDYKVYVASEGSTEVIAYRKGTTWFKPDGTASDGITLFGGGVPNPVYRQTDAELRNPQTYFRDDDGNVEKQFAVESSFEDYDPQLNIMPRLAFSFPISDEAGFFAHYDVLVQRPSPTQSIATAGDYFYFNDVGRFSTQASPVGNPNLKPEKTIDYEVGFQQKISNSSAVKFSAYYKELRDMIQRRTFRFVSEVEEYDSFDNIDFGTIKGFSFAYDLRRTGNFQLNASYTLQFADGTGSDADSGEDITATRNIRTLLPLTNDERHRLVATADYRFGKGKAYDGPRLAGMDIFSDAGINLILSAVSGRPHSTYGDLDEPVNWDIVRSINETRLPWVLNADLQIDKSFSFAFSEESQRSANFNVYLRVTNLFDIDNVINVYQYEESISPDDTGWLNTRDGQIVRSGLLEDGFTADNYDSNFMWRTLGETNYARPRRIYLGMMMNF